MSESRKARWEDCRSAFEQASSGRVSIPGQEVLGGVDGELLLDHVLNWCPHPNTSLTPSKLTPSSTECLSLYRRIKGRTGK